MAANNSLLHSHRPLIPADASAGVARRSVAAQIAHRSLDPQDGGEPTTLLSLFTGEDHQAIPSLEPEYYVRHATCSPRPAMEVELQLAAIQLAAIRENYPGKSYLERVAYRFNREFRRQSLKKKARFLTSAVCHLRDRIWSKVTQRITIPRRRAEDTLEAGRISIAAVCAGGMGDLLIYSSFLDHLYRECGHPLIHAVVLPPRLDEALFVFRDSPAVRLVTADADVSPATTVYDVVLRLGDFLSYEHVREDRLQSLAPDLQEKLEAALQIQRPYRGFIEAQPTCDGMFATVASKNGLRRLDVLGWLGNIDFGQQSQLHLSPAPSSYRRLASDPLLAKRRYITIHNGWDNVAHRHTESATKAWPDRHYSRFVELCKQRFPDVSVVQLGARTSRPIPEVDLCLLNSTSIPEAAWILKHSLLHVDGDSGLVHMARALHTPSLVLFGPTNHQFFRYDQNITLTSTICNNCWWSAQNWMSQCVRGLAVPECMRSILPEAVMARAERHLASLKRPGLELDLSVPYVVPGHVELEQPRRSFHPRSFHSWRKAFLAEVFSSDPRPANGDFEVAFLRNEAQLVPELESWGGKPRLFRFDADACQDSFLRAEARDGASPAESSQAACFGSIYNIPAETASFDAVAMSTLTPDTLYPEFALLEALRIVREGGHLALTFDYSGAVNPASDADVSSPPAHLQRALRELGVASEQLQGTAGGLLLRKTESTDHESSERHG